MKPLTLLATIAGGMVGILTLTIFGAGLRAPAAPGSIIAVLAQTPGDSFVGVSLSVLLAATTSFVIASIILRASRKRDDGDLAAATAHGGHEGQEERGLRRATGLEHDAEARPTRQQRGRDPHASRSTTSCSPATPAWDPVPWAPPSSATR